MGAADAVPGSVSIQRQQGTTWTTVISTTVDAAGSFDAQFQLIASREGRGQEVNPRLVEETGRSVDRLHSLLRQKRETMLPALYTEAQRFLDKLDMALKVLQ